MAIVTGLTKRVEIPHEEGQWIIIRQLSKRQKEKAAEARLNSVMKLAKSMGPELMDRLGGREGRATPTVDNPNDAYDWPTVLKFGIADWSYDEKLSPEAIDELDEATANFAFEQILAFSGPASEEEAKND